MKLIKGPHYNVISTNIDKIISDLKRLNINFQKPLVQKLALEGSPFAVLISTILSLRTKDTTTEPSFLRLWSRAKTPKEMLSLSETDIQKLIYPVGFYKVKAKNIIKVCKILLEEYNSIVPSDLDTLLTFPGVGRKTANLVVTAGYNLPGICVDTHVHRISNRLGFIKTKTPDETEFALREYLPQKYWIEYNEILVAFGQNHCSPISPHCSNCPIRNYCAKIGVSKYR